MKLDMDARYTKEHEWIRKEGELFIYGISDHAQDQLSDIVFLEPPEVGDSFAQGDSIGVVESVKAASDLYLPMSGEIVEVNGALVDAPEIMNSDPYGEAWIIKFKASDPAEFDQLMSPEDYEKYAQEEE
ncbi:MAG: glycine cleavage system protein GcvH [Anaerolineales bacterium]